MDSPALLVPADVEHGRCDGWIETLRYEDESEGHGHEQQHQESGPRDERTMLGWTMRYQARLLLMLGIER